MNFLRGFMLSVRLILLCVFIVFSILEYLLSYVNLNHMKAHGGAVPPEFESSIDPATLQKAQAYTIANTRFSIVSSIFGDSITAVFIFAGLLPFYDAWIGTLNLPFIVAGWIFFLVIYYVKTVLSVPFSLYHAFSVENRFGFNTMTVRLWITDFLKSLIIGSVLISVLTVSGLWIVSASPAYWWLWIWIFLFAFSIFMMYVSPYLIEPLFNIFEVLDDEALKSDIVRLAEKVDIKVSRILKVDASKRSKHTNAYFNGIGKTKRIVLYDTLIQQLEKNEILAVLAHEMGHWRKKHIFKRIVIVEIVLFIGMYGAHQIMANNVLAGLFDMPVNTFFAKAVLTAFLAGLVLFPFNPLFNAYSRKHEKEADQFACDITEMPGDMASSLIKLSKDNLSNLFPHPLYVAFHYSHPPVVERIRRIKQWTKT